MKHAPLEAVSQEIVVDEVFPHAPELLWKTLTNGELIGRWLMAPTGFAAVKGTHFTFQTTPGGAWSLTPAEHGTRLRLVHSGFATPQNDSAYKTMGEGWKKVFTKVGSLSGEAAQHSHENDEMTEA